MKNDALLIIDLVNDYLDKWEPARRMNLVSATNRLATAFRERSLPVIWVRQEFLPDLSDAFPEMRARNIKICIVGTQGAALHPALDFCAGDMVIIKKRYSAFFGTTLEDILEEYGVRRLTLCGINTHACIRMAAIDAYQRDLEVVVARECIGSYDQVHESVTLDYLDGKIASVLSIGDIVTDLRSAST